MTNASAPEIVTELPVLVPRPADSNKGTFGRALIVAGSRRMSGAAVLCASAALRGGAGLVFLAVPEGIWLRAAVANPCYMTLPLPEDDHGQLSDHATEPVLQEMASDTALALGPGLGRGPAITALVLRVLAEVHRPVVLDADALNALQGQVDRLTAHAGPVVLTPHPGEFARLSGADIATVQANRRDLAIQFASQHRLVLVLKGHGTIVTDGRRVYTNTTGNPGMATGGTGDVLTGVIAALLAQGLDAFAAAQLGVYVHGLAGDLARDRLDEVSLIATDLLDHLASAFRVL
jgi:NAD(P)H-hydrate epimerase